MDRFFGVTAADSSIRQELLAGISTFLTMSFIVAVNPMFLEAAGIPFAPTLGDVGCTLSHPASSSHRALTTEGRAALGISEGYFRLSVGIEPPELVLAELDAALEALKGES